MLREYAQFRWAWAFRRCTHRFGSRHGLNWEFVARDPALQYLSMRTRASERRLQLRPMTGGEALDLALRAFRAVGAPILRLSAVPALCCYLVVAFFGAFVAPGLFWTKDPQSLQTQAFEVLFVFGVGVFVALPLFLLGVSYISGLVTRLVSDFVLGNVPDETTAVFNARRSLWAMCAASFQMVGSTVLTIGISFGLLFLSAFLEPLTNETNAWPAVIAFVASVGLFVGFLIFPALMSVQALAPAVAVLEGRRAREAARRSRELMKGTRYQESGTGKILMLWFVCLIVFVAIYLGTEISIGVFNISGLIQSWVGSSLFGQVLQRAVAMLPLYFCLWILIPLWCATTAIIYYDRRIRLEGYDIEVLSMDARRTSRQSRFQL